MKKILLSISMIAVVGVVVAGATGAFFSDTETSTGNTFTAGAIDLGVDNESYYNNLPNLANSWGLDWDIDNTEYLGDNPDTTEVEDGYSLPIPRQFFTFRDLKPGDSGEDTISLHVNNNDSYLCADVKLTSDDDNDITEPEGDDGDIGPGPIGNGDLADAVNFYWWADDGDNVFECVMEENQAGEEVCNPEAEGSEHLLPAGPLGNLSVDQTATVDLADADTNIWGDLGPLPGGSTRYIAKAWCFGESEFDPYDQDGLGSGNNNSPVQRPVVCDGEDEDNMTQTDSFTADISFRAVQSRHNASFECDVPNPQLPSGL
ncbi:hypothetical protein A3A92_00485 [Candidatus Nomurabacteria bacterium RIFCSPLOWO2_01_FULL_37_49]|nr:MAG: hypothetical protein A3A92_00485 [Candidatus Nomurabacteria bacterium RIFCSPLOWO2_01_FULL_37_49]